MTEKNIVTIYDIAVALDLSPSTVSRALGGLPLVHKDTRKIILQKARDLGYRQNIFAKRLRMQRTHLIGALVPKLNSTIVPHILAGIEMATHTFRCNIIVQQSMGRADLQGTAVETFNRACVDGLIIISPSMQKKYPIGAATSPNMPFIVIDAVVSKHSWEDEKPNPFGIAHALTDRLAKAGCKRIAYVKSMDKKEIHDNEYQGYRKGLLDNNLPHYWKSGPVEIDTHQRGHDVARQLTADSSFPDGIIFSDQIMAAVTIHQPTNPDSILFNDNGPANLDRSFLKFLESDYQMAGGSLVELGKFVMYALATLTEDQEIDPGK